MSNPKTYEHATIQTMYRKAEIPPPFNLDAERAVLGAVLVQNASLYAALELFDPEDFYRLNHRKIFEAMLTCLEQQGAVDLLVLRDELERRKQLEEIGGPAYLAELVDQVPSAANITFHAGIVHEKAISRRLMNASIQIACRCHDDQEPASVILEDAQNMIFNVAQGHVKQGFVSSGVLVKQSFELLEELAEKKQVVTGVPTGYTEIDYLTTGLQPSDLIILAARPSMGKTALALCVGRYTGAKHQIPTAIFSLEMSKEQVGMRLLCSEAKVNYRKLIAGQVQEGDWERLAYAAEVLAKAAIHIDDTPALNILEMRAKAKQLKMKHGLGLVIVDYLQLMTTRRRQENKQQEVTEISRSLKALAKELNVPVLALSQLSRACETRTDKRPILSDLRESGAIEQDADVVMCIYRDEVYYPETPDKGLAEILFRKQRNGEIGTAYLSYLKEYTRFENLERHHQPAPDVPDDWQTRSY
jgi:replicative DNA helicase